MAPRFSLAGSVERPVERRPLSAFRITANDGSARAGVLDTAHGPIPTPAFMPVGTKATVKSLHPDEVRALGAHVILGNAYHLHFRPGESVVESLGGIHAFSGLGRPDPHRLGWLPGLLAPRHDSRAGRRRCDVSLGVRRVGRSLHARGRGRDPASSRLGHRNVPGRLPPGSCDPRRARAGRPADDELGRASGHRAEGARPAPLRDLARAAPTRSFDAARSRRSRRFRSTGSRSAASRWASRVRRCSTASNGRRRPFRTTSRATSWGSAIPWGSSRSSPAEWTCSTACCRPAPLARARR